MTNLHRTKATWLASMRAQHASDLVTYRRGAVEVQISAQAVPISYESQSAGNAVVTAQRWDWIVSAADLVDGEITGGPLAGDRIEQTVGDVTRTYEAMPIGTEAAAEPLDVDASQWRVHTKLIAETDA